MDRQQPHDRASLSLTLAAALALAAPAWAGQSGYTQPQAGGSPSYTPSYSNSGGGSQPSGGSGQPTNSGAPGASRLAGGGDEARGVFRSARANEPDQPSADIDRPGSQDRVMSDSPDGPRSDEPQTAPEEAPPAEMTLSDARMNFETVVQTFVGNSGDGGPWTIRSPRTGKRVPMTLKSIDKQSVARGAKPGQYTGRALLAEPSGAETSVLFTVDLSGSEWKVVSYDLPKDPSGAKPKIKKKPGAAAKKKARKAKAAPAPSE